MGDEARDAKIISLYGKGLLIKAIAAKVGMAPNSIGIILKRHGIERPTKPQKRWHGKQDITSDVQKLWNEGLCASQIAERLNDTRSAVDTVLGQLNVRSTATPRHRYDGVATIGRARRHSRKSGAI